MALLSPSSFEKNAHAVHEMLGERLGEEAGGEYVVQNEGLRDQLLHMALFGEGPSWTKWWRSRICECKRRREEEKVMVDYVDPSNELL